MPPARRATPRRPRWRRRPEDRPEEILRAALRVFAERGFAQARLEEVARKAGVSKGTLYLYFDSKDALFRAVVRATKGPILAESEAWLDAFEGSAREALAHFIRGMWRRMADPDQAAISRLVHSEIKHFPELARFYFEEVVLRARRLLERVLARGVASGEFRPDQARFAARAMPALALMLNGLHCQFTPYDPDPMNLDTMTEHALDLVLHGVLTRPAEGPTP
ncbi:MAG: TetR/AcrR family transcriptional regulator [Gemmatimonadales bacterium]|jgi:AcrR family transcriptional regulator|nr:TetR/AcrR family transcriptional regulator [Gemmatimonadales bacterium]MBP9198479.1 TetR/AcrR family transcriptional regulator [Gemmatimonadales bacterium]